MRCIIKKLEIHNFMSFKDDVIDFTKTPGITSIIGVNNDIPNAANGAGKSSAALALFYCLYGKSAVKTSNAFLKNKYIDATDFAVTTTLQIDSATFIIQRGADNYNASYIKLYRDTDGDVVDITPASIAESDALIIHMLNGLTADIFLKTVFLTPAYGANFFTLSKRNKTEFLNLVSGTNKLYDINTRINKDINDVNTDIKIIDNMLVSLTKANSDLRKKKTAFLEKQAEINQTYVETAAKLNATITNVKADLAEIEGKTLINAANKVTTVNNTRRKLSADIQQLKLSIGKLDVAKKTLLTKNTHINAFIDRNQTLCDSICETCLPVVKDILNITTMTTDKTDNDKVLAQIDKARTQCISDLSKLNDKKTATDSEHETVSQEHAAFVSQRANLERELDSSVCHLKLLNDKHNEVADDVFSDMIVANDEKLSKQHENKTALIKDRQQLSILKFATDSATIHKYVTSRFVQDINHYVSKYLSNMGVNYYCKFDNDFTYTFVTPAGEMTYDNFSSGEKMRLNIAMSFAFRQLLMTYLNIDVNVIILDEYLDSNLDELAIAGITSLLTDIKQNPFYNIFLISHRKEFLAGSIDDIMTVTKNNGISTVSYST